MYDLVRDCVAKALLNSPAPEGRCLRDDTPLISSGLVDSLSLAELLSNLEKSSGISIPRTVPMGSPGFDDIEGITGVLESLADKGAGSGDIDRGAGLPSPIPMRIGGRRAPSRPPAGFWTWFYRLLFRAKGIRFGKGLRVLGPIMLRLDGNAANIRLGDDVTLMPFVDLKIRENGKIILGNGVVLDTLVRMVAANNAKLELGDEAQIGMGTIVNAGADVLIGRRTAIAGYCIVIASEHRFGRGEPVMAQGYNHSPVHIGEDVWVASQAFVGRGSRIGDGAVISVKSTVTGSVPPYAVWAGSPGRVIKYRS
jgi:acetyltransferase-like isoleucine patch superfamily enzyme